MNRYKFFIIISFGILAFAFQAKAGIISKPATNLGLVGYWSMNEGTGSYAGDSSGNKNQGTLTNGPAWVDGKRGKALNFDGADDIVNMPANAIYNNMGAITVSAWIKPNGYGEGNRGRIVDKANATTPTNGWIFFISNATANIVSFILDGSTDLQVRSNAGAIQFSVWTHVAVTWNGNATCSGNAIMYINGVADAFCVSDLVSRASDASEILKIGNDKSLARTFDGLIDEVRIYNRALSAAEVQTLYKSGAAAVGKTTKINRDVAMNALTSGSQFNTDPSTTASITPGANKLILAAVATNNTMAAPALSGNGLTWVQIVTATRGSGRRVTLYRAMGSSPTAGAITIDFTGTPNEVRWSVVEFDNVDTSGSNGSGAVVQSNTNTAAATAGLTVTLSAFGSSNNATYGAVLTDTTSSITQGSGFTEITDQGTNFQFETEYKLSADTSVDWTWPPNEDSQGLAIEIKKKPMSIAVNTSQNDQITNGLVGMWSFNGPDMSGNTAYDRSGNGNDGTLTNGPTRAPGRVGQALSFDGSNDYVDAGSQASLDDQSYITLSAWINPKSISSTLYDGVVVKGGNNGSWGWSLSSNRLRFTIGCVGGFDPWSDEWSSPTNSISTNAWQHVAMVFQRTYGATPRFYINGNNVLVTKTIECDTPGSYVSDASYALLIGDDSSVGGKEFGGIIDEVRVYNRALTPAEIKRLYNMGR